MADLYQERFQFIVEAFGNKILLNDHHKPFGVPVQFPVMYLVFTNEIHHGRINIIPAGINEMISAAGRQVNDLKVIVMYMWAGFTDIFSEGSYLNRLIDFNFVFDQ